MLESSFRLGSVAGIRIGVHYTWFIVFALITFSLYSLFIEQQAEWDQRTALVMAVLTSLLFFASIVLHELGHSLVAMARGIQVASITLFIFGGVAQTQKDADSAATEFWVAIAGPAVSFLLAGIFYVLSGLLTVFNAPLAVSFDWLATINLMVAVFNLIPGFPLDGGRVFRALVWGATGNASKGMSWAVMAGRLVAYGLMAMGLVIVLQTGLILNGLWMAAIGWFLLNAAEASSQAFVLDRLFGHALARDVMQRDVPMVSDSANIAGWVEERVLATGQRAFLVDHNGQVAGLVTLSDVARIPRARWPEMSIRQVMTPLERLYTVPPNASITQVLSLMRVHSLNQVPVVSDGKVAGWIDRERLLHILQLYNEVGR